MNKAKDSILDRLSHELRTPLAVIKASLHMLAALQCVKESEDAARILERIGRNLNRLFEMQYQLADITQHSDTLHYNMLSRLLELCADDLENLIVLETGEPVRLRIRDRIESIFGPREAVSKKIELEPFVSRILNKIKPGFSHRRLELITVLQKECAINIPPEVLEKIIVGLVKNAVENTPDGGKVEVRVKLYNDLVLLSVCDSGTGITEENRNLLFKNYFTTRDADKYSTRKPYAFNAGGSGFELLRLKIFSERYNFRIKLASKRCPFIPTDRDSCPGNTSECCYLSDPDNCAKNGGTVFTLEFSPA